MRHLSLLWLLHFYNAEGASKSTNEQGAHKKGRGNEHNSKELPHVTLKSKEGKPLHVTLSSKERAQQRHDNIVARNQAAQRSDIDEWDPLRRQRAARQRHRLVQLVAAVRCSPLLPFVVAALALGRHRCREALAAAAVALPAQRLLKHNCLSSTMHSLEHNLEVL